MSLLELLYSLSSARCAMVLVANCVLYENFNVLLQYCWMPRNVLPKNSQAGIFRSFYLRTCQAGNLKIKANVESGYSSRTLHCFHAHQFDHRYEHKLAGIKNIMNDTRLRWWTSRSSSPDSAECEVITLPSMSAAMRCFWSSVKLQREFFT